MRYSFCFLLLITALFTFSCKKEKHDTQNTSKVYDNYTSLKPGNYWIYQDYKLDSIDGEVHALGTYDSVYVEKDTSINGNTYHKYCDVAFMTSGPQPQYEYSYYRDSLSYMVDRYGHILFSSDDFTSVFRSYTFGPNNATPDTLKVTEQMGYKDAKTAVDAGNFSTSTFRRIYHFPAPYRYKATREYDYRYAKNIGLISATTAFYSYSPEIFERRLVRYHVQ